MKDDAKLHSLSKKQMKMSPIITSAEVSDGEGSVSSFTDTDSSHRLCLLLRIFQSSHARSNCGYKSLGVL